MWWLYVLLALFLIIFLILMIRIRFLVGYAEKTKVVLKVLFFKLDLLNRKKKEKKPKKGDAKGQKKKEKQKKEPKEKGEGMIASPSDVIKLVQNVALGLLKKFYGHLRVDSSHIDITVATDDPSKTAIIYGAVCPAVYSLTEALYKNKGKKSGEFFASVVPDFCTENSRFDIYIQLSITVWQILSCLMTGGLGFVKYYTEKNATKKGFDNGRNADEKDDRGGA